MSAALLRARAAWIIDTCAIAADLEAGGVDGATDLAVGLLQHAQAKWEAEHGCAELRAAVLDAHVQAEARAADTGADAGAANDG